VTIPESIADVVSNAVNEKRMSDRASKPDAFPTRSVPWLPPTRKR
jgi:hypothetical protein